MVDIAANIAEVRDRIGAAAIRAGRDPSGITLAAVSKKQPAASVRSAIEAGITDVAENYVQEALDKKQEIDPNGLVGVRWHLIGHLQSNKAHIAGHAFDVIQSIDSARIASALSRAAVQAGSKQEVLVQVHLGEESTKSGLDPERVRDAIAEIVALSGISVLGLMGIAPFAVDPRPYFRQLKDLFDQLDPPNRQVLSMGMSGDFETAIEEGATLVRVGTAIFGARQTILTQP